MRKGISEIQLALLMSLVIALVLLFIYAGWITNTGKNIENDRNQIISAAGCLAKQGSCGTTDNKACIYTYDGKNECGCRAWLGVEGNEDCNKEAGKKCVSDIRGTNYGTCK